MNIRWVWLALVSLAFAAGSAGCGGSSSGSGGGASSGYGGSGSGGGAAIRMCQPSCLTANDCAIPNVPAYDASHYMCTGGTCEYGGCKSAEECTKLLVKPAVCSTLNGLTSPNCFPSCKIVNDCATPNVPARDASHYLCIDGACAYTGCKSAAECATPNVPAYDASHYTCNSGVCEYTGCKSDMECSTFLKKPAVCVTLNGATSPTCNPTCQSAANCGVPNVPAYDPSHYTCTNSLCEYTGCKSAQECMTALMKPATCK